MNIQALFCDGTAGYVIPQEPRENESVRLRFRTARDDVKRVRLMTAVGGYDLEKEKGNGNDSEIDYYVITWRLNEKPVRFLF